MLGWCACVSTAAVLALAGSGVAAPVTVSSYDYDEYPVTLPPNGEKCNPVDPLCSGQQIITQKANKTDGNDSEYSLMTDRGEWYRVLFPTVGTSTKAPVREGGGLWVTLPPRTKVCKSADADPVCSVLQDIVDHPWKKKTNSWEKVSSPGETQRFRFRIPSSLSTQQGQQEATEPRSTKYFCSPPNSDPACVLLRYIAGNPDMANSSDWKYLVSTWDGRWQIISVPSDNTSTAPGAGHWVKIPPKTKICTLSDSDPVCLYMQGLATYSINWYEIPGKTWDAGHLGRLEAPSGKNYTCDPPCCDPVCGLLLDVVEKRKKTGIQNWEYLVPTRDGFWSTFSVPGTSRVEEVESSESSLGWLPYGLAIVAISAFVFCVQRVCRRRHASQRLVVTPSPLSAQGTSPSLLTAPLLQLTSQRGNPSALSVTQLHPPQVHLMPVAPPPYSKD